MSRQTIEHFLNQLTDDQSLRTELSSALESCDERQTGETVIAFANEAGFEITRDDLVWLQDVLAEAVGDHPIPEAARLSDDELDAVNGGVFGAISYIGNQLRQGPGTDQQSTNALNPFSKSFWW
jgi:predicted ribosomally synthesized peptide with nif11-like leader